MGAEHPGNSELTWLGSWLTHQRTWLLRCNSDVECLWIGLDISVMLYAMHIK